MINTLDDYIWRSLPDEGDFVTNPNLEKKVSPDGRLLPYYGNTVIYLFEEEETKALADVRDGLYRAAPFLLAEPLRTDTLHMTLHDLVNAPVRSEELTRRMSDACGKARELLKEWQNRPAVRMHATCSFNMVNTSIVLGLKPSDEESARQLDEAYCRLESVVPLGYALTPHVTLAYYRPGRYGQEALWHLKNALGKVELDLLLRPERLVLCEFTSMNDYYARYE